MKTESVSKDNFNIIVNDKNILDFDTKNPENAKIFDFKKGTIFYKNESNIEIVEPNFDEESSKKIYSFICKRIYLPESWEKQIKDTKTDPCSKIFQDKNGNKKLAAYYD